jgi:electron transport complex protein RnfC
MRRMPHPSGLSALCVVIEPDGRDEWIARQPFDFRAATSARERATTCAMPASVGLGGAVFPSHLKLNAGKQGRLDTLVINGAECEPFITCDDVLMRERGEAILRAAPSCCEMLGGGTRADRHRGQQTGSHRRDAGGECRGDDAMEVVAVPTRYPAGGAKQLIRVLTGLEVPHGNAPPTSACSVSTSAPPTPFIEAFSRGQPLISRIVTVTGNVAEPRNYEVADRHPDARPDGLVPTRKPTPTATSWAGR